MEELKEVQILQKGFKDKEELLGIQSKPLTQAVEGTFRNAEMLAERRDRVKASGESGIKKGNDKVQGEGGMRDEERGKERMGFMAGRTFQRGDRYPVTKDLAIRIGDKKPKIRAVEREGGGRRGAGRTGRERGRRIFLKKGVKSEVIKAFDNRKSFTNVREKSNHKSERRCGRDKFMPKEKRGGRASHPLILNTLKMPRNKE